METESLTGRILNMRIGDVKVFPLERVASVRVLASQTGLTLNRRYCTRTDRKSRTAPPPSPSTTTGGGA